MTDLDPAAIDRELVRLRSGLGRPLSVVPTTGSTNDDAKLAAARGAPHGATVVADAQTAGRGRGGHEWHSPPGENLHLSVVLRPRIGARRVAPLALVAGVAVAATLERRLDRTAVGIKWPNDVVVAGRKLAGILVEGQLRGDRVGSVVVGIGVNVRSERFPDEIATAATSLHLLGARDLDRASLVASVLAELGDAVERFEELGLGPFAGELARRDALAGMLVEVGGERGFVRGIDGEGRLLLQDGDATIPIASGTVAVVAGALRRLREPGAATKTGSR